MYAGTYSGKLALNDTDSYARIRIITSIGQLKAVSGSFKAYIPSGSPSTLATYMMFGVDSNQNGIYDFPGVGATDSLVIAFITGGSSYPNDQWFTKGLAQTTKVHVVYNRTGLGTTEFSSSGTQDTLAALADHTFSGSLKWGDLMVHGFAVAAGLWPSSGIVPYSSYVDNLTVVPLPGALWLLGSGLAGLGFLSRRRR